MNNDELIENNIRLVYRVVNLHFNGNPDLYDIGMIGLVKGARSCNPNSITETSYLCRSIKNEILNYLRNEKRKIKTISIETNFNEELTLCDVVRDDFDMDKHIEQKEEFEKLYEYIDKLSDIEKFVICSRYQLRGFKFRLQKELADMLGLRQPYISTIEKRAIRKLRRMMENVR